MHFARVLREAGLPVGPGHVHRCARCGAERVRCASRDDFYWTLHAILREAARAQGNLRSGFPCLLEEAEDAGTADAADVPADHPAGRRESRRRRAFAGWRKPCSTRPKRRAGARKSRSALELRRDLHGIRRRHPARQGFRADDVGRAGAGAAGHRSPCASIVVEILDAALSARSHAGDAHRSCGARSKARCAPAAISSTWRGATARSREPPLVVLCDISGSCSNYSRMFLHFLHGLMNDREPMSRSSCSARGSPMSRANLQQRCR